MIYNVRCVILFQDKTWVERTFEVEADSVDDARLKGSEAAIRDVVSKNEPGLERILPEVIVF